MSMTKLLYGLAALPLIAGVASAAPVMQSNDSKALAKQPVQLSEQQMDKVTAGWDIFFWEFHNTGAVAVSVYQRPNVILPGSPGTPAAGTVPATPAVPNCAPCYLYIEGRALSIGSVIYGGPVTPVVIQ